MDPDELKKMVDEGVTTDLEIINKLRNVGFFSEMINELSIPGIQYLITTLTAAGMAAQKGGPRYTELSTS